MTPPVEHTYAVTPIIRAGSRRYLASCPCEYPFTEQDSLDEAGLDGLDHVRRMQGRKTRRQEIAEETEAKRVAAQSKRYGVSR